MLYEIVNCETNIQKPLILSFVDDGEVKIFLNGVDYYLENFIYNLFENGLSLYLRNFNDFLADSNQFDTDVLLKLNKLSWEFDRYKNVFLDDFKKEVIGWKRNRYNPMINLIQSIPENMLIEFIISLINLTTLKRKYSLDVENVGGDVLVAKISPNDIKFIDSKIYTQ